MKVFHGGFQGKMTKLLLVLAVTSQTMVSCGVRDDGDTLQVQAMEREKTTETESIPEEEYERALDAGIMIEFCDGDWEQSVTRDVRFVNRVPEERDVRWVSSDESVITNEGKVTRQQEDKTVTITADVSNYNGKKYRRNFSLTVKRKNTIDVNSLEDYSLEQLAEMNSGDENYEVETNESGYVSCIYGKYSDIKVDSWEEALASLYNIKSLLGIGDIAGELQPESGGIFAGDSILIDYDFKQVYKGVEVWGCGITVSRYTDEDGRAHIVDSSYLPIPKDMDITPGITIEEAGKKAEQAGYGKFIPGGEESEDGKLYIINDHGTGRLVWYLLCEKDAWWDQYIVLVDAKTGEVVYASAF